MDMTFRMLNIVVAGSLLGLATFAAARLEPASTQPAATQPTSQPAMVNTLCPVQGDKVDPEVFIMHDGRKIGFCCSPCVEEFKNDPEKYLKELK
jgi:YHS domain-containing protein